MNEVAKVERSRLSADDWAAAALDLIAEQGVAAVAVETLARRMNVTKGSFYWHFPTREALLIAALKRWREDDRGNVLARLDALSDPRDRLYYLFRLTARTAPTHKIYSALLQALDHPLVREVMAEVSRERLAVLEHCFRDIGLPPTAARHRARLAYSAYVGHLQLALQLKAERLSAEELDAYVEHVIDRLIPS